MKIRTKIRKSFSDKGDFARRNVITWIGRGKDTTHGVYENGSKA